MSQSLGGAQMPGAWPELDEIAAQVNAGLPHGTVFSSRPASPSSSSAASDYQSARSGSPPPSRPPSPRQVPLPPSPASSAASSRSSSPASSRPSSPVSSRPSSPTGSFYSARSTGSSVAAPDMPPRLPLWEWRSRVDAFKSVDAALELGAGILASAFAGRNVPVAWWTFAPIAGGAYEAYKIYKARNPDEAAKEVNPLLKTYYEARPLLRDGNMSADHRATVDYLRRASARGVGDATSATISLIGGHFVQDLGWTFNSLIHAPAAGGALYTLTRASWMLVRRLSTMQRADDQDLVNTWITGLIGLKAGRLGFRIVHSLLPRFENQQILSILAGATAIRLGGSLTIGGYINAMASHIHFKAYEEQGHLAQFPLRPPADIEAQIPLRGRQAGPNSELVFMLFEDALVQTSTRNVAGDIIQDPAGWLAIAHRLTMT
ncbi:hypothetical protein [Lichenicola sp.]|uniref:hypothetical protein n=1 Tax=Lichenicola sp. TaxID=2804529 RepID=UPI003B000A84